ncbi:hypothetical protein BGC_28280 [Burkholderia sp. 3C]
MAGVWEPVRRTSMQLTLIERYAVIIPRAGRSAAHEYEAGCRCAKQRFASVTEASRNRPTPPRRHRIAASRTVGYINHPVWKMAGAPHGAT